MGRLARPSRTRLFRNRAAQVWLVARKRRGTIHSCTTGEHSCRYHRVPKSGITSVRPSACLNTTSRDNPHLFPAALFFVEEGPCLLRPSSRAFHPRDVFVFHGSRATSFLLTRNSLHRLNALFHIRICRRPIAHADSHRGAPLPHRSAAPARPILLNRSDCPLRLLRRAK